MPPINTRVLALLASLLVLVFCVSAAWFVNSTKAVRLQIIDVTGLVHRLESTLGFGGMIHDFKNAVLRPAEPRYLDDARAEARDVLALVDRFERIAADAGTPLRLDGLREVAMRYQSQLPAIAAMHARGATAREIDAVVRVDDAPALEDLAGIQAKLVDSLQSRLDFLRSIVLAQLAGTALLGGLLLWLTLHQQRLRERLASTRLVEGKNRELDAQNRQLKRATEAHRQFAGIAAHDLKAPARQISMLVDVAEDDRDDPEQLGSDLARIRSVAQRMGRLVDTLLEFTRSLYRKPELAPVDMQAIALLAVNRVQPVSRDADETVQGVTVHTLPDAIADRELMTLVFTNLIGNALKYRKPDTPAMVDVRGETRADDLLYCVEDQGIGIDAGHAETIFEPMRRLHRDDSPYGGQGIGLALVRSIVEAHGGTAWLDTGKGDGTRFCFTLPRQPLDWPSASAAHTAPSG